MRFPCNNWWFAARRRRYTNAGSYKRHKGLRHWVPWSERQNAAEAVTDTKALGAWVVVAEQTRERGRAARAGLSGNSSVWWGARWRLADVVEAADAAVVIPTLGMANSLNVATAAAILLYWLSMRFEKISDPDLDDLRCCEWPYAKLSSNALASFRSSVSNPSVNQP